MEVVTVEGLRVPVRRSVRARRVRLVARAGSGVELVLPTHGGERTGRRLVASNRDWIARQTARLDRRVLGLERAYVVWRHGLPLPLHLQQAVRSRVEDADDQVTVSAPDLDDAARMVERWYREQTRRVAAALVEDLPAPHPSALRIADGMTRWGSCSRNGTVSLSWRLMLAPVSVFDYVVVHELCHLRHLNHGAGFWAAVTALRPDWQTSHQWLRQHGAELHAYDPAFAVLPLRAAA